MSKRENRVSKTIIISSLVCPDCGNVFPIPRRSSRKRPEGHFKHLWCPFCKKQTRHVESNYE